jgi:hypothetical protein
LNLWKNIPAAAPDRRQLEAWKHTGSRNGSPAPGSIAPAAAGSLEGSPAAGTEAEKPGHPGSLEANKGPAAAADKGSNQTSKQEARRPAAAGSLEGSPTAGTAAEKAGRPGSTAAKTTKQKQQIRLITLDHYRLKRIALDRIQKETKKSSWKPGPAGGS